MHQNIETKFKNNNILYLEGYLFDKNETKQAMIDLCKIARNQRCLICLSLSDSFCVERHKEDFFSLIKNYVDILFGNDQEINTLLNGQEKENLNSIESVVPRKIVFDFPHWLASFE